jgi:hypothetical protein
VYFKETTAQFTVDKVNATGKYRLIVCSDRIGAFTLKVNGATSLDSTIQALETRIQQLEKELAEAKAKLKALKAKAESPRQP